MASVCFYFQVHQPYRLRRYSVFADDPFYFDNEANEKIMHKVAEKCYRPATAKILDLVKRHEGRFRVAYSISGTCLDQFEAWAPDVLDMFKELGDTGACEFLGETSHHSPCFLFSRDEFDKQVDAHRARIQSLFGQTPTVFRNTELMYHDDLAWHMAKRGDHRAIICEGVDRILAHRSPNYVYVPPRFHDQPESIAERPIRLLLKNYRLSDDIAFRFGNRGWEEWPLSTEKFARWVNDINGDGYCCNLFMDYETIGEHQWADTGIFEFLDALPGAIYDVNPGHNDFLTPSQVLDCYQPVGEYAAPNWISWADTERDLSAWLGNPLQDNAVEELFAIRDAVYAKHEAGDEFILEDWRKLSTSDHLYYMCTKYWADGDVHKYFSPYDSPYDAYINFMNVLDNMKQRVDA
jgi:alpha-amylase